MKCLDVFLLLGLAWMFSCAESVTGSSKSNLKNNYDKSEISMEKTACYGRCPVYKIVVYGTGKVLYEGKRNVDKVGKYEKQLTGNEIESLFSAYDNASFFDFRQEYTANIMDLPVTYLYYKDNKGFDKKIKDHHGAPDELKSLEKLVEDIANSKEGWKKQVK